MNDGLQDVGTGRAIARQTNVITVNDNRQFVLRPCQRKAQAILAHQHRAAWQFIQSGDKFVITQPLDIIVEGEPAREARSTSPSC